MRIFSVLQTQDEVTEFDHPSLKAANLFCVALHQYCEPPFVLTLYRYRHFRGDKLPSKECMAIYSKDEHELRATSAEPNPRASPPVAQSHPASQSRAVA